MWRTLVHDAAALFAPGVVNHYIGLMKPGTLALLVIGVSQAELLLPQQITAQERVIGRSVEDRPIGVEVIGDGPVDVIIVGGIHGGYEANSIALARRFTEHYRENPSRLPERFTLHVIDNMNPDGLYLITEGGPLEEFDFRAVDARPGRFNANGVDLNRNWDGDWKPQSTWRNTIVDTGAAPFSEPETRAVRDHFREVQPAASVFYQIGHRNVTVELSTHYVIEWDRNLAGFQALLDEL